MPGDVAQPEEARIDVSTAESDTAKQNSVLASISPASSSDSPPLPEGNLLRTSQSSTASPSSQIPSPTSPSPAPALVRLATPSTSPPPKRPRLTALRTSLRVVTYFFYDTIVHRRDLARVLKVLTELAIDESLPPSPRAAMTYPQCFLEFLAPCGASSLIHFLVSRRARRGGAARGAWVVVHRVLRQALICRLFFPRGSVKYNLASLLGVVCTFFREDVFRDLLRVRRWPRHVDVHQGGVAVLRTVAYTVAFMLPLQEWCGEVLAQTTRRSNAKKLVFALSLANARAVYPVARRVFGIAG